MSPNPTHEVTSLLQAWGRGDDDALQKLVPLVYRELRLAARRYMAGEKPGHLLQTTALVNETYLRLVGVRKVSWQNRAHFLAICAQSSPNLEVHPIRKKSCEFPSPEDRRS